MAQTTVLTGVLLEDTALSLEELARACSVEPAWVAQRVQAGILLNGAAVQVTGWRFTSVDLVRARQLRDIERAFDANEDLAALVVDLTDEVKRLRAKLRVLGME